MKTITIIGIFLVHLALLFYSIGIISEQKSRLVRKNIIQFIGIGVIIDILATILMIAGSSKGLITVHGLIGYSGLTLMLIDFILLYRFFKQKGDRVEVPIKLHIYSRVAYIWWIVAYITGSLLIIFR